MFDCIMSKMHITRLSIGLLGKLHTLVLALGVATYGATERRYESLSIHLGEPYTFDEEKGPH